jgi:glycosyltransferase involved in cell wall biosynthesis
VQRDFATVSVLRQQVVKLLYQTEQRNSLRTLQHVLLKRDPVLHLPRKASMVSRPPRARIALVSHRFVKNDGQGRVNYEVAKAALESGYHVTILAIRCAEELASHPSCHFVRMSSDSIPLRINRDLHFASVSARWLRQNQASLDLVMVNGFVTWEKSDLNAVHFVHAAWARNPWYPFKSLKPYSLYQRIFTQLNCRLERAAFLRSRKLIAVSRPLVAELAQVGVRAEDIEVIWNGVDTEQFQLGMPDRDHFGLPKGVPLALFIGDIQTPRKNLETVLYALKKLGDVHLAVAGSTVRSPYPDLAVQLGIANRVHFLGKVTDVPLLMRSVDIFTFPSRYEAHPLVLLEAMASGLPSVVSGTFGAEEFIGESGIILKDPNDAQELARAIRQILESPQRASLMRKSGRNRALEMQWSTMAAAYLAVFEKTLKA